MPTTETLLFDVEKILSPIEGENPAGALLRYEGTYDRVREARRADEADLEQGVWQHDLKKADWDTVNELCLEALEKRSKDLQLAAWLLESWLHLHGFPGVREGLRAVNALCWRFWEVMHPGLDDPEYRLAIFNWIDSKLALQLKFIPITHPAEASGAPACSWSDWEMACRLEQTTKQHPELKKSVGKITLAMFRRSVAASPRSFFKPLRDDVASALEACGSLEKFLDGTYGKDAPSLRTFRQSLESVSALIGQMVSGEDVAGEAEEQQTQAETVCALREVEPDAPSRTKSATVRTREEAFQMLEEAAAFLQKTEPHSPVSYLVRRAISWGSMTLDELLPELVRNQDALTEALKLLQIQSHQ